MLLVGRLVYEKGFQLALDALPGVIERVENVRFLVAGWGTHEAELKAQAERLGLNEHGSSSAGSAMTRCTRSTGSRICAWCPRSMSRSGWLRSRRWPPAVPASSPTPAACARSCRRASAWAALQRRRRRAPRHDDRAAARRRQLRDRLVAEASEHVLSFDWEDIATRTRAIYGELALAPGRGPRRRAQPSRREESRHERGCRGVKRA